MGDQKRNNPKSGNHRGEHLQSKARVQNGGKGLMRLFENFHPRVFSFLAKRLKNRADAQELTQEAFLRLMRVKEPDLIENPEAYLFRIAANLANELMLSERNKGTQCDIEHFEDELESDANTFQDMETEQRLRRLTRTIEELPPMYQSVLLLCKRDGHSHQEIAEKLNLSIHTVRKYLVRAVSMCRAAELDTEE